MQLLEQSKPQLGAILAETFQDLEHEVQARDSLLAQVMAARCPPSIIDLTQATKNCLLCHKEVEELQRRALHRCGCVRRSLLVVRHTG